MQARSVLTAYWRITNATEKYGWIQSSLIPVTSWYVFTILCYNLHRLVQLSMNKVSQRFLKDMVEFNHPLFLLYQSIFHNSVLQVAWDSSASSHCIQDHKYYWQKWLNSIIPYSCYITVFFIILYWNLPRLVQFWITKITDTHGWIQSCLIPVIPDSFS